MHHPAELKLHQFMSDAVKGKTTFSEETAKKIGAEVADAVIRQFGSASLVKISGYGCPTLGVLPANCGLTRTNLRLRYQSQLHLL